MDYLAGSRGLTPIILSAAVVVAAPAQAQIAADQARLRAGAPTREEIERVPRTPAPAPPPRLTLEGGIERAPCPLAEPRFANVTVTLSDVRFDSLRGASPEILRPAFEAYLGKTAPIAVVCEIRDAAATILRREGFLAAVQVPPQRIENGVIHFDVLMAKLVAVQVRGDAGRSEALVVGYLNKMIGEDAFNERAAERYLLLARDLPGYDIRLTLRPAGTAPGEVVGEVAVQKIPFTIDANVQNYGSKDVGRESGLIRAEAYDLFGFGDRLTLGAFSTADFKEQQVYQLGYDMRLGDEGLTIGTRLTYAKTRPDLGALKVRSETLLGSIELAYPLLRTQARNLGAAGGLDLVDQKVWLLGAKWSEDRLRILYARLDLDMIDRGSIASTKGYSLVEPRWRVSGSLEIRKGLDIFNGSDSCDPAPLTRCNAVSLSRVEGKPTAALIRLGGVAEYRPLPTITFSISSRAQYSGRALISFEEYSAGNYTIGRGYDPGTLIGDSGAGFQLEMRFGSIVPRTRDSYSLQPFVFADQAWVWNRNRPQPAPNDPEKLASVGGGVRAAYGNHARLDVALAKPLRRAGLLTREPDARLLVSLTTKLSPW